MSLSKILIEGRVEDVYKKYFTDNTSTFLTDVYMNEIWVLPYTLVNSFKVFHSICVYGNSDTLEIPEGEAAMQ